MAERSGFACKRIRCIPKYEFKIRDRDWIPRIWHIYLSASIEESKPVLRA